MSTALHVDLLALGSDSFREVVDAALRAETDDKTARALREPPVLDRFYRTLIAMRQQAEAQLGAKKADLSATRHRIFTDPNLNHNGRLAAWIEAQGRYGKWRAGTLRFRAGLEREIAEVRRIRDALAGDSDALLRRIRRLEYVIRRHRDNFAPNDEPTEYDLALWEALNEQP